MEKYSFAHNHKTAEVQLRQFSKNKLKHYGRLRNFDFGNQKENFVSSLSPAITRRIINEKLIISHILKIFPYEKVEKFIQEICWRTYWKGYLEHYPTIWKHYVKNSINKHLFNHHTYKDAMLANTGIKCFDHWISELLEGGYLHNHARMWFASIWIHTLRLPWEIGAKLFLENLIDADSASNTLSWRWVAGLHTTGKTYLANADNIRKFTKGQFYPKNQLAKSPINIGDSEHNMIDNFKYKKLNEVHVECFLIHENDLSLNRLVNCDLLLIQKSPLSTIKRSKLANQFISNALNDFQNEISRIIDAEIVFIHLDEFESTKNILKSKDIKLIHTSYPSIGFLNDHLNKICKSLDVAFKFYHREWDIKFWPHSSKGFFKLKSKIPEILRDLNY